MFILNFINMPRITIIPTSHIARESLEKVKETIEKEKPDCLAVELDIDRYHFLKSNEKGSLMEMIKNLGLFTSLIYFVLKKLQNYLGSKTGIIPGSEMIKAVDIGLSEGITVAFVDQNIGKTMFGIKKIKLSEKLKLFWILIKGIFGMAFPFGKKTTIDLNKVPEKSLIDQAMSFLKKELPGFYRVLVEDRNRIMAKNLKELGKKFDNIVCVVGAGHEEGMKELLNKK